MTDMETVLALLRSGDRDDLADAAERGPCRVELIETRRARAETPGEYVRSDLWHVTIGDADGEDDLHLDGSLLRTVTPDPLQPGRPRTQVSIATVEHFPSIEAMRWATYPWEGHLEQLMIDGETESSDRAQD